MLVGDLDDPLYLRQKELYERKLKAYDAVLEGAKTAGKNYPTDNDLPERPMPPRLDPARFNAASGAIRTWNELKHSEVEALLGEVQETNPKLLEIIEAKERQQGGGSA